MRVSSRRIVTFLALITSGCGSNTTTSGGGGGRSGVGGGGGSTATDPACPMACVELPACQGPPGQSCADFDCELSAVCPVVTFAFTDGLDGEVELSTPGALACAFEALRDGTIGRVPWEIAAAPGGPGFPAEVHMIHVVDNRQAFVTARSIGSLGDAQSGHGPSALAPESSWTQCLGETQAEAQVACLRAATVGCDVP